MLDADHWDFRIGREKSLLGKILHASARDVLIDFTLKLVRLLIFVLGR